MYERGDRVHVRGFTYVGPVLNKKGTKLLVDCGTCQMWVEESWLETEQAYRSSHSFLTFPIRVQVPSKDVEGDAQEHRHSHVPSRRERGRR